MPAGMVLQLDARVTQEKGKSGQVGNDFLSRIPVAFRPFLRAKLKNFTVVFDVKVKAIVITEKKTGETESIPFADIEGMCNG